MSKNYQPRRISITVDKDDHGRESLQQQFCLACKPSYMRQWGTLCLELCLAAWQIYTSSRRSSKKSKSI
ncbi:hypothetical protein T4D_8308 [Trichinella pseudospiralis]|uniref:Uncharacterized protein n=1 Tax=Trichinella pseudospiralis TaxID=6337 RepID=A0A0V1F963_TRIPS|nr:hypothetical protein T4D_8308 [Trichinella pseudospiralis]